MNKVENVEQLRAEISRLKMVAKQQETEIRNDWKNVEESIQPANLLWNGFSGITGINMNKHEFLKGGVAYGISLLIRRFVMKSEIKMEEKVYHLLDNVFVRIKSFMNHFTDARAGRDERKTETD